MHGGTEEKTKTNQLPHPKGMRLPLHITKPGEHEGRMQNKYRKFEIRKLEENHRVGCVFSVRAA